MMKTITAIFLFTLAIALGSCSSKNYSYACILIEGSPGKILAEGKGNPNTCKALFEPPEIYIGPDIVIPESASVYGMLVITNGSKIASVPLCKWMTETGEVFWACRGPAPRFAIQAKTAEDFITSIKKAVGKKV